MSLPARAERPKPDGTRKVLAPNLYFDRGLDIDAAKILPGEYYVTERDMMLVTVLGSCVTACIRDKLSGIGGMNHFMLPDTNPDKDSPFGESARYGAFAMEILINSLLKLGAHRTLLEAKVFGGGNVLPGMTVANVGQRNADFVLRFLETEKIRVVAKDLVDVYPRKIYFFPQQNGRVLMKKLRAIHNDTIFVREKDYSSRLLATQVAGEVELFN
jgi:chemotaxis protein CheD